MAITPQEAGEVSEADKRTIEVAESVIDSMLRGQFQGSGRVTITEALRELSERSRREVLRRYMESGWDILELKESYDPQAMTGGEGYWHFSASATHVGGLTEGGSGQ